jgi:hypothetical protein
MRRPFTHSRESRPWVRGVGSPGFVSAAVAGSGDSGVCKSRSNGLPSTGGSTQIVARPRPGRLTSRWFETSARAALRSRTHGYTRERTIVQKSGSPMATRSWFRSIMLSLVIDWSARWKQYGSPVPSSPNAIQSSR